MCEKLIQKGKFIFMAPISHSIKCNFICVHLIFVINTKSVRINISEVLIANVNNMVKLQLSELKVCLASFIYFHGE